MLGSPQWLSQPSEVSEYGFIKKPAASDALGTVSTPVPVLLVVEQCDVHLCLVHGIGPGKLEQQVPLHVHVETLVAEEDTGIVYLWAVI